MEKFVPYVNLQRVKDSDGKIVEFIVRTVSYLPDDSEITKSGEGPVADNILYRPLTISYDGTSTDFDYFEANFTIKREDVGLLERGVNIKVKNASESLLKATSKALGEPDDEGIIIDY